MAEDDSRDYWSSVETIGYEECGNIAVFEEKFLHLMAATQPDGNHLLTVGPAMVEPPADPPAPRAKFWRDHKRCNATLCLCLPDYLAYLVNAAAGNPPNARTGWDFLLNYHRDADPAYYSNLSQEVYLSLGSGNVWDCLDTS